LNSPTVNFSVLLTNTAAEGVTIDDPIDPNDGCRDNRATTVNRVPATLAAGATAALSATYSGNAPFTDTLTCSGRGQFSRLPATVSNTFTCTPTPGLRITERTCTAQDPDGVVVEISGVVTNTGNETLVPTPPRTTICTDDLVTTLNGAPPSLFNPGPASTVTGTYFPDFGTGSYSDTLTCIATGAFSGKQVTATGTATCTLPPRISVFVSSCVRAVVAAGTAVAFNGSVNNSGGEVLTDVTCDTNTTMAVSVQSATLAVNAGTTFSGGGNFVANVPTSVTVTCRGTGATSRQTVTSFDTAQCLPVGPRALSPRGGK
jgi:hypothetical protein